VLRIDEEAVELLRQTTETDSPSSAELSTALARLALDLMAVGCYDEALHVGEERVKLCRSAAAMCSTPSDDLAGAPYMLGVHMRELGREEDALLACEQAVELRRNVQETGAMPVLSLANSLENLGVFLRALGWHEDSLGITQEAVDLQCRLLATAPDLTLFLIDSPKNLIMGSFAHSLENLAFNPSAVGNAEDAVRAAGESVDIYRSLPDRTAEFEAGLASVLCSLAAFLRTVDRQEDALRADKEGAESSSFLTNQFSISFLSKIAYRAHYFVISQMTRMLDIKCFCFDGEERTLTLNRVKECTETEWLLS
jgi:tetratricopeptide (TPR) repeat protein